MKALKRRHTHRNEHVDSEGSWAISYGDMITLLLSFFVLYFTVDHEKANSSKLQDSLLLKLQESGIKAMNEGTKSKLNMGNTPGEGVDVELVQKFGAQVYKDGDRLIVEFDKISFFEIGEVDLNITGLQALDQFAKIYTPYAGQYTVQIQAYTDTRKVTSAQVRFRDNLELSALRAVAALRALQKAGIPLARLKTAGFGELIETQENLTELIKDNDPRKFTRKVVLVISPALVRN